MTRKLITAIVLIGILIISACLACSSSEDQGTGAEEDLGAVDKPATEPAPATKPVTTPIPAVTPTDGVDLQEENLEADIPVSADAAEVPQFELATDFPRVPDQMPVYKPKPPAVTIDSVRELARKFGFEGEPGKVEGERAIIASDKVDGLTRMLRVRINTGGISYTISDAIDPPPDNPPTLTTDEEAMRIATEFLREKGLLSPGREAVKVVCGGGTSGYGCSHLLVTFTPREIDGVPFTGPGDKFNVRVGDKGKVVDMIVGFQQEFEPYKETVPIISPEEAYGNLKTGRLLAPSSSYSYFKKVIIRDISLAYWLEPMGVKQEYVLPVYVFRGEYIDEDGETFDFIEWVDAVKKG